jgi:hypothetical protein
MQQKKALIAIIERNETKIFPGSAFKHRSPIRKAEWHFQQISLRPMTQKAM